jgi:glutamate synthase (NADPH/NADH) small chain
MSVMIMPGGLLRYGIPDFKLEKWVVERRVKLMEGGRHYLYQCNTEIGKDISRRRVGASLTMPWF